MSQGGPQTLCPWWKVELYYGRFGLVCYAVVVFAESLGQLIPLTHCHPRKNADSNAPCIHLEGIQSVDFDSKGYHPRTPTVLTGVVYVV